MEGAMEKPFDLEARTRLFAKSVRAYVKLLSRTEWNVNVIGQLARASCSVPANYNEYVENLGRKDALMKLKISRREAKESELFLDLSEPNECDESTKAELRDEALQLVKIFSSMLRKAD